MLNANTSASVPSLKVSRDSTCSILLEKFWCLLRFLLIYIVYTSTVYVLLLHFHPLLLPYLFLLRFYLKQPQVFSFIGLLLLSYYLCLVLHEGGHALSACFLRYRVLCYVVGPLEIVRKRHYYRIGWHKSINLFSGYVSALPLDTRHLRLREMLVFASGPLANLLQTVLCLLCLSSPGLNLSFSSIWFFRITAGIAFLACVGNCLPLRTCTGSFSDGAAMLLLLKGGPPVKRWLAIDALSIQIAEGKLPREWDVQYMQQALCSPERSLDNLAGYTFAYCRALEEGDVTQAREFLERRLALRKRMSVAQRRWLALEAAFFEARYHQNAQAARVWLALAKNSGKGRCARFRAEAAILLAEGDKEGACICIEKGLHAAEEILFLGAGLLEKRWLQDLAEIASV